MFVCFSASSACLPRRTCGASEYEPFSLSYPTGLQSELLRRSLSCRIHQLWSHSALGHSNVQSRVPGYVSVPPTPLRAHPCFWRSNLDTLPPWAAQYLHLADLSCWFLWLKTETWMKFLLEDKEANACEGRATAHVSLSLETNGHLCIQRHINCWNRTNERDIISFREQKKPSWSPNEGWIGLSLATWLRTDRGCWAQSKHRGNEQTGRKMNSGCPGSCRLQSTFHCRLQRATEDRKSPVTLRRWTCPQGSYSSSQTYFLHVLFVLSCERDQQLAPGTLWLLHPWAYGMDGPLA